MTVQHTFCIWVVTIVKNICVLVLCLVLAFLSSCTSYPQTEGDDKDSSITEFGQHSTLDFKNIETTLQPLTKLELTDPDEWSVKNQNKFILLNEEGYYYYINHSGKDGPDPTLVLDSNGTCLEQTVSDYFHVYFIQGNTLYGYDDYLGICKYENGQTIPFHVNPSYFYFTEDYIYFSQNEESVLYQMDYTGQNTNVVLNLDMDGAKFQNFVVYQDKIWFNLADNMVSDDIQHNFCVYDMQTQKLLKFDRGNVGKINNGWMYYIDETHQLYRFHCKTYCVEPVCETRIEAFDFYDNYILYLTEDSLYRFNTAENTKTLSANQLGDSYYLWNVQCEDDRIFVAAAAGSLYTYIGEINLDGQIIQKIHED